MAAFALDLFHSKSCAMIGIFIIFVIIALYCYATWTYDYWKKKGVAYEKPLPFIGNMSFLMRISTTDFFRNSSAKFNNVDYYGIWLFRQPALVVRSPDLARKILVKDFEFFTDRYVNVGKKDPLGSLNIFTVNEPLWSKIRKRLTNLFTSSKLRGMAPTVQNYAKQVVEKIYEEQIMNSRWLDIRDLLSCYTTDVVSAAAFGVEGTAVKTGSSTMRSVTKEIMRFNLMRGIEFCSIFYAPYIAELINSNFFPGTVPEFFRKVFWTVAEQRKDQETNSRDLVDLLLRIRESGDEDITDDVLVAQAAVLLQGGFDTTATSLSWLLLELAHHPHVQEKLYNELRQARDDAGTDNVDIQVIQDLPYLNMVVKENLRKYTAMGWLDRKATKTYQLDKTLTIEKGTPVYVNAVGMHYNPEYYPDPHNFDPERFSSENEKKIKPFTYLPFGAGPRNCIGLRFAGQTIKTSLWYILLTYELLPAPGIPSPRDMKCDHYAMFMAPASIIHIDFKLRDSQCSSVRGV